MLTYGLLDPLEVHVEVACQDANEHDVALVEAAQSRN
jgi:hypothetical protein